MNGPEVGGLIPADEVDLSQQPAVLEWVPLWFVQVGEDEMGITVDDHCFVPLAKDWHGNWKPTKWLPWQMARRLGELADTVTP